MPAPLLPDAMVDEAAALAVSRGPIGVKRLLRLTERAVAAAAFASEQKGVKKGAMGGGAAGATGDGRGVMRALRQYTEVGEVNWVSV